MEVIYFTSKRVRSSSTPPGPPADRAQLDDLVGHHQVADQVVEYQGRDVP